MHLDMALLEIAVSSDWWTPAWSGDCRKPVRQAYGSSDWMGLPASEPRRPVGHGEGSWAAAVMHGRPQPGRSGTTGPRALCDVLIGGGRTGSGEPGTVCGVVVMWWASWSG